MNFITVACSEFANLNHLAVYSVVTNAIDASFGITTLVMLGHLGKGHLSAGVIALAFYNISWYFMEGLLTAQDSLVARSFALNDRESARYWSYISFAVALLLCVPATVLFIFAAIIIQYAFQIRSHTAIKAAEFLIILLPGLWVHSLYRVAQKYLQCQQKMKVPIICGVVGIGANLLGSYLLSFVFGLGFSGCAWATTIARGVMLTAIVSHICKTEDIRRALEELTILSRSLRNQYNNLDEVIDLNGSHVRKKSILVTDSAAKKKSRKGRKVRIAPTMDDSIRNGDSGGNAFTEGRVEGEEGVEMVGIEHHSEERSSPISPLTETDHLITDTNDYHENVHSTRHDVSIDGVSNTETDDSLVPDADEDGDTQALLGSSSGHRNSSHGGAIDVRGMVTAAPKRVIIADVLRFLFLGMPGGLVLGMEFWVFEVVTVIVAHMGSVVVGTNQILLTITSFFFLSLPFALSIAGTVQISRQLAKKRYKKARTTAWLCILEGSLLMALAAALMWTLRGYSGYIFTNNEDITNRLRTLAPYNAGFQVAYGVYGSAQGVLRATSHQLDLLGWTFIAVWLVGLPLGCYLAFVTRPTYGLEGLWVGLIVGMGLLAFVVVLQVFLLDWEKEARKAEFRLRRGGVSGDVSLVGGAGFGIGSNVGAVGGARRGGRRSRSRGASNHGGLSGGLEADDIDLELAIPGMSRLSTSVNPLRFNACDVYADIPLPSIGSRAAGNELNVDTFELNLSHADPSLTFRRYAGGLPLNELFGPGEDLDELEYVEFGTAINGDGESSNNASSVGDDELAGGIELSRMRRMPLPDDEEDFKRNK